MGHTRPSTILSPTMDVARKHLCNGVQIQEQGICHSLCSIGLFNIKLLMGRDLEDIQPSP